MKSIPHALPLAMVCALLGATALVPFAHAQTSGGSTTEISPSTSTQDMTDRRDQDRRDWRSSQDEDDRYGATSSRNSANRSYAEEEDDVDQDGTIRRRWAGMSGMAGGMMDPDMMRMHMRMMRAHHRGEGKRGARLRLKRGDSSIDIRCPARENIAACVDSVGKLMDRLQAMPGAGTTTTSPTRP